MIILVRLSICIFNVTFGPCFSILIFSFTSSLYNYYQQNIELTDDVVLSARVLGKHQGTVPARPNVPPEISAVSTGPEQLSSAEMERRMKLLREDR